MADRPVAYAFAKHRAFQSSDDVTLWSVLGADGAVVLTDVPVRDNEHPDEVTAPDGPHAAAYIEALGTTDVDVRVVDVEDVPPSAIAAHFTHRTNGGKA